MDESEELEELVFQAIKEEAIKEILRDEEKKIQRRKKIVKIASFVLSAAAVLVIGLFLFKNNNTDIKPIAQLSEDNNYKQIAEKQIEEIVLLPKRGSDSDIFYDITKELKEGNKAKVIQMGDSLINNWTPESDNNQLKYIVMYYVALCHFCNSDIDKAQAIIEEIKDEDFLYHPKVLEFLTDKSK